MSASDHSKPAPERLLLGVLSDTHGDVARTQRAVRMLESLEVQVVLHAGDIGSTAIPPLLAGWPTHFVFGNVDLGLEDELRAAILAAGLFCHDRFGELTICGRRIALVHSDERRRFRDVISGGEFDLVCYGHTHVAEITHVGQTMVLNPGAVQRANPHSVAVVELPKLEATIVPLE